MGVVMHQAAVDAAMDKAALKWAHRVGRRVVNASQQHCPVDEGRLRASIDYTVNSTGPRRKTVVVGSPLDYAAYHHTGTGIHGPHATPIVPVTRKVLKFKYSGPTGPRKIPKERRGIVFARSVQGMKANPFLVKGLRDVLGRFEFRSRARLDD